MSINIRYPNITSINEKEQIAQIRSYLHQLVDQLNYALLNIGAGDGAAKSTETKSTQTHEVQGAEVSYYELRSLVIQSLQKVDAKIDELDKAKENGEFDGKDGYTPVKYIDYFTEEDQAEIVSDVVEALPVYDGGVATLYNGEVVYE